jgi:hypothetical protein
MQHFRAPWGRTLVVVSILTTLVCIGATLLLCTTSVPRLPGRIAFWLGLLPAALVIGCLLTIIRGYTLTPDTLFIHRLFWRTRVPLHGLRSVVAAPDAMRRSLRLCGNGGVFSFTGFYRSRALGSYRAFVTDLHRTVVLRFPRRTIVVSPDAPDAFVTAAAARIDPADDALPTG